MPIYWRRDHADFGKFERSNVHVLENHGIDIFRSWLEKKGGLPPPWIVRSVRMC